VIAINEKCTITSPGSYKVCSNGYSLPIAFNFASCIPETDVSMTGTAKESGTNTTSSNVWFENNVTTR
jgi:hypothetical protein